MASVFIKVPVSERLPNKSGIYTTNRGDMQFTSTYDRWYGLEPQWWMEEIALPTEEEITIEADEYDSSKSNIFENGANFILNILREVSLVVQVTRKEVINGNK